MGAHGLDGKELLGAEGLDAYEKACTYRKAGTYKKAGAIVIVEKTMNQKLE